MLVVDQDNKIIKWLGELGAESLGAVHLDLATFEVANGISNELILMSLTTLAQLNKDQQSKLASCRALVVIKQKTESLKNISKNVVAIINQDDDKEVIINQIENLEEFVKTDNQLKSQLISLNMELNEIIGGVEDQLFRVKRAYEQVAPKRLEKFQGFKIYSKYAAGEDLGGEFFDLFGDANKIFIMMSNTSSYLASSAILQLFTELKAEGEITSESEKKFINGVKEQIQLLIESQKKDYSAQLLTCILDINTLKMEGHVLGNFKTISSNTKYNHEFSSALSNDLEQVHFSRQVARGERFMLCSPGFMMNWASFNPKFMIEELIMNKEIKVLDILDEIFFQLKKESKNGFLKSDASSIIMEVQDNVILEV